MPTEAEWLTRKTRIDTKLGTTRPPWTIIGHREGLEESALAHHAVMEYPTSNGPADYALFVNGRLLGIIEAKKVGVGPQNVLEQARRYSRGATTGPGNWNGYRVPFLYATNGEVFWYSDERLPNALSSQVTGLPSPDALEDRFSRDLVSAVARLQGTPLHHITKLRDYQRRCITAVEEHLATGQREMLVAMATGTGKTYVTVAQIFRLLESRFARRVLFLVDRKALAAQAVREFNAFSTPNGFKFTQEFELFSQRFQREDFGDDEPFDPKVLPQDYLTAPRPAHTFVYVCTIQRIARYLFGAQGGFAQSGDDVDRDDDADLLEIPPHAFDLIIADECHRGYSAQELGVWSATLDHFDAVKVGLTATPAAHTVGRFGHPVFRYGIDEAIRDGFLVDWDAVAVSSNVKMNGVFLREGEAVTNIDTDTGAQQLDLIEDERTFPAEDVERAITAPDSNRRILEEVARHAAAHEKETGRFPKILIFAANDLPHTSHADQVVLHCRQIFNQGDAFVQKITGSPSVDRPLQRIREFRNRPNPEVVVTVDMLSTGVDIPALEFIVFLRPVKSRILWEQMLGRGTRRCDAINKAKFTVFDCFDGTLIRYFRGVSSFQIEEPRRDVVPLPQVIDNIWNNVDRRYWTGVLVKRLHRIAKSMSGEANTQFSAWIPDGDVARFARELPQRLERDFTGTMRLLRAPDFKRLLENYPRPQRTFVVAPGVEDQVSSETVDRFGPFEKPEDYLSAFARFVRENSAKVNALGVLLRRPAGWGPQPLQQLRDEMLKNQFDEAKLRKAHASHGTQALADVISIVKHAAADESPLLSAEERVTAALARLERKLTLSTEQQQWLTLIREHLISNLSLDEADFDNQPIFANRGGAARARKLFRQQLPALIRRINEEVAA
jgi:type I restriction enzyme R subunit